MHVMRNQLESYTFACQVPGLEMEMELKKALDYPPSPNGHWSKVQVQITQLSY